MVVVDSTPAEEPSDAAAASEDGVEIDLGSGAETAREAGAAPPDLPSPEHLGIEHLEQLERIARLREQGVIDDADAESMRSELRAGQPPASNPPGRTEASKLLGNLTALGFQRASQAKTKLIASIHEGADGVSDAGQSITASKLASFARSRLSSLREHHFAHETINTHEAQADFDARPASPMPTEPVLPDSVAPTREPAATASSPPDTEAATAPVAKKPIDLKLGYLRHADRKRVAGSATLRAKVVLALLVTSVLVAGIALTAMVVADRSKAKEERAASEALASEPPGERSAESSPEATASFEDYETDAIPSFELDNLQRNLELMGFECSFQAGVYGEDKLCHDPNSSEYVRLFGDRLYDDDPYSVSEVTVGDSSPDFSLLKLVAAIAYDGARPESAQNWVEQTAPQVARGKGKRTKIGPVTFVLVGPPNFKNLYMWGSYNPKYHGFYPEH